MDGKEISQAQYAQANLFINGRGKIFTSVANASIRMEINKLLHAFNKSALQIIKITGAKIYVLQ